MDREELLECIGELSGRLDELERQMEVVTAGVESLNDADTFTGLLLAAYGRVDGAISAANGAASDADDAVRDFEARVDELNEQYDALNLTVAIENLAGDPTIQELVTSAVQPLPFNSVVAFERECRLLGPGWATFEAAVGRMIVGAGPRPPLRQDAPDIHLDESGAALTVYRAGDLGGQEATDLEWENLPNDTMHPLMMRQAAVEDDGELDQQGLALYREHSLPDGIDQWIGYFQTNGEDSDVVSLGGNLPHNNMPPFIALHFCEYVGVE